MPSVTSNFSATALQASKHCSVLVNINKSFK